MTGVTDLGQTELRDADIHELITGVGESGIEQFPIQKIDAHRNNVQHVAVSVFVFHGNNLLIQQRARSKYHSGGLWANSVCSHPRWNESASDCASRRLDEELGWSVPLEKFGQINYAVRVDSEHEKLGWLYENEQVHCFFGQYDERCNIKQFNRDEVADVRWVNIDTAISEIQQTPEQFSEWFKIYMSEHLHTIKNVIQHNGN